jgi:probable HAF family extracellular repeat protein
VVGASNGGATEWSGGSVINLGSLPGSTFSGANGINDAGQVVGYSSIGAGYVATEWSGGKVINLGDLPGSTGSIALDINDVGVVVGYSRIGQEYYATEWSGGNIIRRLLLCRLTYGDGRRRKMSLQRVR